MIQKLITTNSQTSQERLQQNRGKCRFAGEKVLSKARLFLAGSKGITYYFLYKRKLFSAPFAFSARKKVLAKAQSPRPLRSLREKRFSQRRKVRKGNKKIKNYFFLLKLYS